MTHDTDPRLDWSLEGEPRSGRFGDVYFSKDDGLAESRAVFLAGCALPEAWAGRRRFVVGELGFGTGLNIAALLTLWRDARPEGGRLNVFSIEAYPLSLDEARRALAAWPEIAPAADALLAAWPFATPGFHRLDLPDFDAVVDLFVGDVEDALDQWTGRADAWFLDGFSPALNPAMWSDAVLDGISARSSPDARLATFTVAGHVRRGLAARGFAVDKRPGHGRKRERLEARRRDPATAQTDAARVVILGAGVAGAALARALSAQGAAPIVIDADDGSQASGFPLALVTPRLDAGDAAIAGLHAQALERAATLYRAIPQAVAVEGVLQLEGMSRDARRFDRIAEQALWPAGMMRRLDAAAVAAALGEEAATGGLAMDAALAVRPGRVRDAFLAGTDRITARVARIAREGGCWRLLDAAGDTVAEAEVLILSGGWSGAGLWPSAPVTPVRGQADWVEAPTTRIAAAWGGYAVADGEKLLFGATHDRGDAANDPRADDTARNLEALRSRLPALARKIDSAATVSSRAAVRATTPDRLPLAGQVDEGLFVLGGLGSRGFCVAPLLAEHVAALVAGAPSPLAAEHARRVDPLRFVKS
ncbi:MAG: tRNA (5-methylaminomethyl-2-thiouridine)(34)-methyltransferase MnmD [Brevundimonas sp.]|uniref:tRNA (5-methylaminomethyl-2-thiouridine)(34)-methyltransferase MnmD n=1 Tax=Brevundimonas sp. TaxID=1871086 RepID=UPI00391B5013